MQQVRSAWLDSHRR